MAVISAAVSLSKDTRATLKAGSITKVGSSYIIGGWHTVYLK